jgi:hypothetical protein
LEQIFGTHPLGARNSPAVDECAIPAAEVSKFQAFAVAAEFRMNQRHGGVIDSEGNTRMPSNLARERTKGNEFVLVLSDKRPLPFEASVQQAGNGCWHNRWPETGLRCPSDPRETAALTHPWET